MKNIVVILENDAKEQYINLKEVVDTELKNKISSSFNQTLFKAISKKIQLLKEDPEIGRIVKKSLIPKKYKSKALTNLWIINLPNYWRLLYNIQTNEVQIICFILEFGDHNKYNKLFNFKKR